MCTCESEITTACVGTCAYAHTRISSACQRVCAQRSVPQLTDDVVQDVYEYLLWHRPRPFPTRYLTRLAWYKLRDRLVSPGGGGWWHPIERNAQSIDEFDESLPSSLGLDDDQRAREDVEALLTQLPEHERLVVAMRWGLGDTAVLNFGEIAVELSRTSGKRWSRQRVADAYTSAWNRLNSGGHKMPTAEPGIDDDG